MTYTKRLPEIKDIVRLSTLVSSYPVTRRQIVRMARIWNMNDDIVSFLRQFSADEVFTTRTDFVTRCDTLSKLIRQEWESPHQQVLSF
jgi:hypothetical protein